MDPDIILSQYPLRWAPSSDRWKFFTNSATSYVSIPSQVGTLFGHWLSACLPSRRLVSIPSQVGTLFGPATA